MGSDAMILIFWMLSFKPAFLLSSFTFIKMLLGRKVMTNLEYSERGSLACCSPWGHKQTWLSNWTTTNLHSTTCDAGLLMTYYLVISWFMNFPQVSFLLLGIRTVLYHFVSSMHSEGPEETMTKLMDAYSYLWFEKISDLFPKSGFWFWGPEKERVEKIPDPCKKWTEDVRGNLELFLQSDKYILALKTSPVAFLRVRCLVLNSI